MSQMSGPNEEARTLDTLLNQGTHHLIHPHASRWSVCGKLDSSMGKATPSDCFICLRLFQEMSQE